MAFVIAQPMAIAAEDSQKTGSTQIPEEFVLQAQEEKSKLPDPQKIAKAVRVEKNYDIPYVVEGSLEEEIELKSDCEFGEEYIIYPEENKEEEKNEQTQENSEETEKNNEEDEILGVFKITAYCGCSECNGKWTGMPAKNGEPLEEGVTIAVDPSVIPLNSYVEIEGVGVRKAQDTGSGIKGNRIDLYFSSHSAANDWGVREKTVYVVK